MPDDPLPAGLMSSSSFPANQLQLLVDFDDEALSAYWLPSTEQLKHWVLAALSSGLQIPSDENTVEVSLSAVSADAIRALNSDYRNADKATNVLSFPAEMPPMVTGDMDDSIAATLTVMGDVVICPEVLTTEATEQGKSIENHWAHMVIHSVLHLNGLDHADESSADAMESLEIQILSQLDIPNPYLAASAKQS